MRADPMPTGSTGRTLLVLTPRNGDPASPPSVSGRGLSVASMDRCSPSRSIVNVTSSPTS